MNAKEIMKEYLKKNGYDGLHHMDDCSCVIDDLFACGEDPSFCEPGHKKLCKDCELKGGECYSIELEGDFCITSDR